MSKMAARVMRIAGGADVEVGNETQPGNIALHSVSGEAEEESDGDRHEESNHQELHAIPITP